MTPLVEWEWSLLTSSAAPFGGNSSHRVARRIARGQSAISSPTAPPRPYSGKDPAIDGPLWRWRPLDGGSLPPQPLQDAAGNNYVFAFWKINSGTTNGVPVANTSFSNAVDLSGLKPSIGEIGAKATAYFIW